MLLTAICYILKRLGQLPMAILVLSPLCRTTVTNKAATKRCKGHKGRQSGSLVRLPVEAVSGDGPRSPQPGAATFFSVLSTRADASSDRPYAMSLTRVRISMHKNKEKEAKKWKEKEEAEEKEKEEEAARDSIVAVIVYRHLGLTAAWPPPPTTKTQDDDG